MNYFYELPLEIQKYIYILRAKQIIQDKYYYKINKLVISSKLINDIIINPKYWVEKTWIDNWNIKHSIYFINLIDKQVCAIINFCSKSINNYCDKFWWNNKIHYFVRALNYFKLDKIWWLNLFKKDFKYNNKCINNNIWYELTITYFQNNFYNCEDNIYKLHFDNLYRCINRIEKFTNLKV